MAASTAAFVTTSPTTSNIRRTRRRTDLFFELGVSSPASSPTTLSCTLPNRRRSRHSPKYDLGLGKNHPVLAVPGSSADATATVAAATADGPVQTAYDAVAFLVEHESIREYPSPAASAALLAVASEMPTTRTPPVTTRTSAGGNVSGCDDGKDVVLSLEIFHGSECGGGAADPKVPAAPASPRQELPQKRCVQLPIVAFVRRRRTRNNATATGAARSPGRHRHQRQQLNLNTAWVELLRYDDAQRQQRRRQLQATELCGRTVDA